MWRTRSREPFCTKGHFCRIDHQTPMPQITEIIVSAGRTFNHPHEQYSNLRPEVTLKAQLGPDEDPTAAVRILQAQAEAVVEDHKQSMLRSLEQLHELSVHQQEVVGLERQLTSAQRRLDEIRSQHPQLTPGNVPENHGA